MVGRAKAGQLSKALRGLACLAGLWAGLDGSSPCAPLPLTLQQASARRAPDFVPLYEGQTVSVKGQVSGHPVRLLNYAHVGIQDAGHGLVLEGGLNSFDRLAPGSWVAVEGVVSKRGGLPVVIPSSIQVLEAGTPPAAAAVSLAELQGFGRLGQLVSVEARIVGMGDNAGGNFLLVGRQSNPLKVFLPFTPGGPRENLSGFRVGDRVRVKGIASQYCPMPPHNTLFQLLVQDPGDAVRTGRAALVDPWVIAMGLAFLAAGVGVAWIRERKSRLQRVRLRKIYSLGEEILGAATPADSLDRLNGVLPQQFGVSRVRLYFYSRGTKSLEEVVGEGPAASVVIDAPAGFVQRAVACCFRNKMLLSIPDSRHSPFRKEEDSREPAPPRGMLFLPLLAQGEVEGVLQIDDDRRAREFKPDDQVLIQHLANQAGVAHKLFEQRSMREQLFRSEKLAAVGQLMSGVVNELHAPLAAISAAAADLAARDDAADLRAGLEAIAGEAGRAASIVSRLVSFVRTGPDEGTLIELNELLRRLCGFREREWKARGISVRCTPPREPVLVSGSAGQLEQAFLNLLVHAEQALADSPVKEMTIELRELAGRARIEIGYSTAENPGSDAAAQDGSGLTICRSVIAAQNGSVRTSRPRPSWACFEVDLPAVQRKAASGARAERRSGWPELTALSIESDRGAQQRMVELLSARELRVVPVSSAVEGLDLMQRMRFEVVLWAVSEPGPDFPETLRHLQEWSPSLTLVAQARHPLPPVEGCRVLVKPVEEDQLDLVLESAWAVKAAAAGQ